MTNKTLSRHSSLRCVWKMSWFWIAVLRLFLVIKIINVKKKSCWSKNMIHLLFFLIWFWGELCLNHKKNYNNLDSNPFGSFSCSEAQTRDETRPQRLMSSSSFSDLGFILPAPALLLQSHPSSSFLHHSAGVDWCN